MKSLYKAGWKYSGGNIATNSGIDPLWHATVFSANARGESGADSSGLFFNGFHLTMDYGPAEARINPHVFFDAQGNYDEARTTSHQQTKKYIEAVGDAQWQFDLKTAQDLSKGVTATLGPILEEQDRKHIEEQWLAERQRKKEQKELEGIEAARQEAERVDAAALALDEETSITELLKDVSFHGPSYKAQFKEYIKGDKNAIKDGKLKQVAEWYLDMRDNKKWIVPEKPQAAYTNWGKTPVRVVWKNYANALTQTWRAKDPQTMLMKEYRLLRFNGYASYKLHPNAIKAPKV